MARKKQFSLFDHAPLVTSANPLVVEDSWGKDWGKTKTNQRDRRDVGLMALDLATRTGYCLSGTSGVWNLAPTYKKAEKGRKLGEVTRGIRQRKFWTMLSQVVPQHKIKIISFEKPLIYRAKKRKPNFVGFELAGVLKLFCELNNIRLLGYNAAHIKQAGTGRGNANKVQMTSAAIARFAEPVDDDNEADALHLYHLTIQDLKL